MKVMIIAGGKGTRIQSITKEIPKTMLPINDKPVLEYQIKWLKKYNISDIILCIGHLGNKIREYFGDGSKFNVKINYEEEKELLGVGGAIKNAKKHIPIEDKDFIVLLGDIMTGLDFKKVIEFHKKNKPIITIVLHESDHPHDSDIIRLNKKNQITEIIIKNTFKPNEPVPSNLTKTSLYIMNRRIFDFIPDGKCDIVDNVIIPMIKNQKEKIYGFVTKEFIKDIGTPERYEKVKKMYENNA